MSTSVDLVISAYRDNLDWVRSMQPSCTRIFVYDKWDGPGCAEKTWRVLLDDSGKSMQRVTYAALPNVGKLDHTFAHHIVEHYDDLADWIIFTPDGPADHLHGASMGDALTPGDCLRVPRLWRGRDWGADGRLNWKSWGSLPARDGKTWGDRYAAGEITPSKFTFVEWMKRFIGFDPNGPDWPGYQPGGILAVPRRCITYLPREFYERLRERLSHDREPEEGHFAERSWTVIFSGRARYVPAKESAE